MSVLSTNAIHEAMDSLLDMSSDQRRAVTDAWINNQRPASKIEALAHAVLDYYSDATFEELVAMAERQAEYSRPGYIPPLQG